MLLQARRTSFVPRLKENTARVSERSERDVSCFPMSEACLLLPFHAFQLEKLFGFSEFSSARPIARLKKQITKLEKGEKVGRKSN